MKTSEYLLPTVAALALLSSNALSQITAVQKTPNQIQAGIASNGLPKGQLRPMTVELAKQLVAAAKKASCSPPAGSCSGVFAVVDDAGVLLYLEVIDGVFADSPELAIKKAKTAALWRQPTQYFLDAVNNKVNTSYADGSFQDMTTSPGGVPLFKDGRIVGGIGLASLGGLDATKQIEDAVLAQATKIFGEQ